MLQTLGLAQPRQRARSCLHTNFHNSTDFREKCKLTEPSWSHTWMKAVLDQHHSFYWCHGQDCPGGCRNTSCPSTPARRPSSWGMRKTKEGEAEKAMKHGSKAGTKGEKENKGGKNKRQTLRRHNILGKPEPTQRVPASNNANLTFVMAVP